MRLSGVMLAAMVLAASTHAGGGLEVQGVVRAYTAERQPGEPVAGAIVRFTPRRLRDAWRHRRTRVKVQRKGRGRARFPDPPPPSEGPVEVRTDAEGRYRVRLPESGRRIVVEHPDFAPWRVGPNMFSRKKVTTRDIHLWRRSLLEGLPPSGSFPQWGQVGKPGRESLVELRPSKQALAMGEVATIEVLGKKGVSFRRMMLGCNGCPLDPDGNEHPSGFLRNVFCKEDPCRGRVEVSFHRPGRFVVTGNAVVKGERLSRRMPYVVFQVGPPPQLPSATPEGRGKDRGWMR